MLLEEARTLKPLKASHIKIGWVSCRVRRKMETKWCYCCFGFGHMMADCRGSTKAGVVGVAARRVFCGVLHKETAVLSLHWERRKPQDRSPTKNHKVSGFWRGSPQEKAVRSREKNAKQAGQRNSEARSIAPIGNDAEVMLTRFRGHCPARKQGSFEFNGYCFGRVKVNAFSFSSEKKDRHFLKNRFFRLRGSQNVKFW